MQVDGERFAVVTVDVLQRLNLHVGDPLLAGMASQLLSEAEALATYDRAVRMLTSRGRSGRDLQRRLTMKGEKPEHAAAAVERLRAQGHLDDTTFARARARSGLARNGRRRVESDLRQQGVERNTAREAVDHVVVEAGIDGKEQAKEVALKRVKSLARLDDATRRRRLHGFLGRRGFTPDEIRLAVAAALATLPKS